MREVLIEGDLMYPEVFGTFVCKQSFLTPSITIEFDASDFQ